MLFLNPPHEDHDSAGNLWEQLMNIVVAVAVIALFVVATLGGGSYYYLTRPKRRYLSHLRRFLNEMPFIYEGTSPTSVAEDYVEAEYERLNLPGTKSSFRRHALTLPQTLKEHRRVLILGNAGMGKTTFERYSLIQLIDNPRQVAFLDVPEKYLPIFIPLKAIDNSEKDPILRYITSHIAYLSGESGIERLRRLADEGRLLICLDGYDEIPLPAGSNNYVRAELNHILSTPPYRAAERKGLNLINCRIWLSSRREFFFRNPISDFTPSSDVVAITLTGVGERRLRIIKGIFDRYEREKPPSGRLLDAEYFLASLDTLAGDEIVKLSHNPLFLTVMCYIYATEVIKRNTHDVAPLEDPSELILACIDLLISDLDENKARDLADAKRAALLLRRNSYVNEKREFIQYYAYDLLIRQAATFDLPELKNKVKEFFTEVVKGTSSQKLIAEMDRDIQTNPHFALQLIYCGVFTVASRDDGGVTYDFAHRRFREVLAGEYVNAPNRYLEVLKQYYSPGIAEFMTVFRKTHHWRDLSLQKKTLDLILSGCIGHRHASWIHASTGFIGEMPLGLDVSKQIETFLLDSLQLKSPQFRLSEQILWASRSTTNLRYGAENSLIKAVSGRDPARSVLAYGILRYSIGGESSNGTPVRQAAFQEKLFSVWISCAAEWGECDVNSLPSTFTALVEIIRSLPHDRKDQLLLRCSLSAKVSIDWIASKVGSRLRDAVINALSSTAHDTTSRDTKSAPKNRVAYLVPPFGFDSLERWLDDVDVHEYLVVQSYGSTATKFKVDGRIRDARIPDILVSHPDNPLLGARMKVKDVNYFAIFDKEVKRILGTVRGRVVESEEFDELCYRPLYRAINALLRELAFNQPRLGRRSISVGQVTTGNFFDHFDGEIEVVHLYAGILAEIDAITAHHSWDQDEIDTLTMLLTHENEAANRWCEFFENEGAVVDPTGIDLDSDSDGVAVKGQSRESEISQEQPGNEVYVSYAWGGEGRLLANQLEAALVPRGVECHIDTRDIAYRDSISQFMTRLGRGKCVVVLIDSTYLKSVNCMRELVSIVGNGQARERIFPIILKDANIFAASGILDYVKFWENKKRELDSKLKDVGGENLAEVYRELDLYAEIRASFSRIADILRDMNALSVEEHLTTSFQEIASQIEARLERVD